MKYLAISAFLIIAISLKIFLDTPELFYKNKKLVSAELGSDEVSYEENLEMAMTKELPQKIIEINNDLKISADSTIPGIITSYLASEDESNLIDNFEIQKGSDKLSFKFIVDKEDAAWKIQKEYYTFDVIAYYNNEIVLQFSGNINRNTYPQTYLDFDIMAYKKGSWEDMVEAMGDSGEEL